MVRHSQAARKQPTPTRPLHQLARLYGVQPAYYDVIARRRRQASEESLLAVLRALGAPVESLTDVPAALREQKQAVWRRLAEPVVVVSGKKAGLDLRLPAAEANGHLACFLTMENGAGLRWTSKLSRLHTVRTAAVERACYQVRRVALPDPLPFGYHRLRLETGSRTAEILLVATPSEAYAPEEGPASRTWGIFLPLHALHTQRSWGSGDFTDLEALAEWVSRRGGGVVATLPFLASFLDEPFQPSPYVPVSRLFWNEFFLDVTRVP
ncbi:MAG: 4-alpha-glucanotransferase, partial [Dehalococcoidia bacterium]